ncbi:phospholipase D-like domain-containing protein [Xanthomonas hortorum pv. vitians]|uniref:phospholipase D-like domain-containing protein n=1 Tax=Xanthomonas hortorum TaxID=56454 RepID=UPI001F1AD747|nr:phospholipase D-like domain-containing protein [Xanthomonas hortorum]MCE4312775.1 phospholipase D-like domain-containing protein [Xanthomonas hortorum pv. vitians]MCE4535372.1 phospholipase D-like domain-containing protein [Xanthomonas hortorum pv. vitians]
MLAFTFQVGDLAGELGYIKAQLRHLWIPSWLKSAARKLCHTDNSHQPCCIHKSPLSTCSFTAPDIAQALIAAKKRGVDVRVVVDADQSRQRSQVAALNTLALAGVSVRLNGRYQIMHDKVIVADRRTVQTGSFNYTRSAEKANSENVIVLWDVPGYAGEFLQHWQSRWDQAAPYQPPY